MGNQIGQKSAAVSNYLNPDLKSAQAQEFEDKLSARIVGQERAVRRITGLYQIYLAGLAHPGRPIGTMLFLGPTGSGKTRVVEAASEVLFGDPNLITKVDCAEFQHSHEIAKLIGSPPGYLGHRETSPMLTQENLDRYHNEENKLSLVLFDEIEKASDSLWQLLLGILDKATLTLGDNRRVDLSQCMIFMTSNLGAGEMSDLITGGRGFVAQEMTSIVDNKMDDKLTRTAIDAARRKFSPEFMNRIDKTVVFKMLRPEHLEQILEIELGMVQQRILQATGNNQFVFSCTAKVKKFLLHEGTDAKYGARHLKRAIEKNIVFPLANLVATGQVKLGDFVRIDMSSDGRLAFVKEAEGALVPVLLEKYSQESGAVAATARAGRSASRREFSATSLLN